MAYGWLDNGSADGLMARLDNGSADGCVDDVGGGLAGKALELMGCAMV